MQLAAMPKISKITTKIGAMSTSLYIAGLGVVSSVFAQIPAAEQARIDAQKSVSGTVSLGKGFAPDMGTLITSVLTFVMLIAALLILMYLIWGGIQWITSGGDKGKTEEARNKITSAVIGLIILAAAWAVFLIILKFLGFSSYTDLFTNIVNVKGT
ncbi:MAG: hypothetical protein A3A82_00440 [Candidatus Pacebacteria bacterium RIFCSPLOWO2_01_FULL_47_12]|nr:MAG: hypothetical protein A3A82_00440 [Candidatus Pacebacteria bacterium RIFCSPLOWO2_01_FULL_47_12]